jgi:transposase
LDAKYPPECTIRIILDNHSAHISKETRAYLSLHPNRFQYVLTPKHGSWLNIVETLFGKMARTFLRHIRVQSLDELKARILKGIEEINAAPVVHRWKNFNGSGTRLIAYILVKRYTSPPLQQNIPANAARPDGVVGQDGIPDGLLRGDWQAPLFGCVRKLWKADCQSAAG